VEEINKIIKHISTIENDSEIYRDGAKRLSEVIIENLDDTLLISGLKIVGAITQFANDMEAIREK